MSLLGDLGLGGGVLGGLGQATLPHPSSLRYQTLADLSAQQQSQPFAAAWLFDKERTELGLRSLNQLKERRTLLKKEAKPMKIKNALRAYMLACTVAVTGKLCVLAHPLVMMLPRIPDMPDETQAIIKWAVIGIGMIAILIVSALLNWICKGVWSYTFGK